MELHITNNTFSVTLRHAVATLRSQRHLADELLERESSRSAIRPPKIAPTSCVLFIETTHLAESAVLRLPAAAAAIRAAAVACASAAAEAAAASSCGVGVSTRVRHRGHTVSRASRATSDSKQCVHTPCPHGSTCSSEGTL